jgi:putative membrane protein
MIFSFALLHEATFSWTHFDIHPSVLIGCIIFSALYYAAAGPLRSKFPDSEPVEGWRVGCFATGTLILFFSLNGPLHDLSDNFLFSAHMVQHLLLALFVPSFWLLGTPAWMLRPLFHNPATGAVLRFATSPLIAFAIYNIVFCGWHLPGPYEYALEHHNVHILQHLMFIASAVLMWWPAIDPIPEMETLQSPLRLLYLFAMGIPMSIVAALITLSDKLLYPFYGAQPRIFALTPLDDQQLGGLIMWIPGSLVFWVAISIIYFRWAAQEDLEESTVYVKLT